MMKLVHSDYGGEILEFRQRCHL